MKTLYQQIHETTTVRLWYITRLCMNELERRNNEAQIVQRTISRAKEIQAEDKRRKKE